MGGIVVGDAPVGVDDARDGAGAAIKFFEPGGSINGDGILDVLMNAGRQFFVRSLRDFATFVHTPDAQRIELVRQGIMREPELIEAYRVRGSYTEFHYHSWVCFAFDDNAGVVRYLRYRLISHDRGPDRGVPRADFQANGRPSMEPWPDDPRPPDFMRQDFAHRVRHGEVRYILQAQFRDAPEPHDANHDLFDPSQRWDEVTYPWLDMFDIRLTAMVEDPAAIAALAMNPNRSPACIRIPLVTSPDQFASLCQGRAILYPGARAARAALTTPESH